MNSIDGLLPCPFCGESDLSTPSGKTTLGATYQAFVRCECGAQGPSYIAAPNALAVTGAREAWNTRTPAPSLGALEKLRALLERAEQNDATADWFAFRCECVNYVRAALTAMRPVQEEGVGEGGFGRNSKPNRDCLAKAKPGEPMFIILGRDPDGGNIVRLWAQRRKDAGDTAHADPVFAIADAMDAWAANPANAPESAPPPSAYPALAHPDASPPSLGVAFEQASEETARLQRDLDITNADHIALWLEANADAPLAYRAVRIVEAYEAALDGKRLLAETIDGLTDELERLQAGLEDAQHRVDPPPAAIHVRFSDTGEYIRKWSREPFDGAKLYVSAEPSED